MKVEIGESLLRSWLRHTKQCQCAELNWKPSPLWEPSIVATEINKQIFVEVAQTFGEELFKKSSLLQLMKQGEVDVLGTSSVNNSLHTYACDIAFHSYGLNYGPETETTLRVTKKLIRSAFLINSYFECSNASIIFASPKVSLAIEKKLHKNAQYLEQLYAKFSLNYSFEIFCNAQFTQQIFDKVLILSNKVQDTSELLLRALQLNALCKGENKPTTSVKKNNKSKVKVHDLNSPDNKSNQMLQREETTITNKITIRDVTVEMARSGSHTKEYLMATIPQLLPKLTTLEIKQLLDPIFCKEVLGLRLPLLTTPESDTLKKEPKRYYPNLIHSNYYIYNDWKEKHFVKWKLYLLSLK